ncbi:uncharacterized protein PHACADRAFT_211599 [Phanerochaete carnosa HHB-10118-sp]|uniref:AMP-dependent synthetase/ligase domain-containing protein n=1 Tax=Phanerochaete carnosa (strain HHB-10118-sp) TaxID=650164 RepID=K5WPT3_PHACS|nr:uncharacterized protein PHACADRAFT_211599 [Phanerochaete carnosa HHB-10118-sp]EKM52327.1 hypothetical protein PHACADRAFT_211599 [Phanerochaete carnosa HHB-10118-sp]
MASFTSPYSPIVVPPQSYYSFLRKNDIFPSHSRAFVDGVSGEHVTRDTAWAQSLSLAHGLRAADSAGLLPLHKGSTVLIVSPNSTLYPVVMMALSAAGICGAHASPMYVVHELAHAFTISNSSHILVHPAALPVAVAAMTSMGFSRADIEKRILLLARRQDLSAFTIPQGAWVTLDDLLAALPDTSSSSIPEDFNGSDAHQTAVIFFSSGTTGRSKAVALTHYNVTGMLTQIDKAWPHYQPEHDVVLGVVPFFHVLGGVIVLLFSFLKGIPVVSLPRYDPTLFLATIDKFQVTTGLMVPPIVNFLAKHPLVDDFRLASLRYVIVGAAPISPATIELCTERFARRGVALKVSQAYGMSETSGCVSLVPLEHLKDGHGSVGLMMSNLEGRIVDKSGRDVAVGTPGELWLRGPNIMKGYVNNPEATAETLTQDGWLKTGDVAVRDSHGFLAIVDRWKELIKYKGFQGKCAPFIIGIPNAKSEISVPPAELESALTAHPLIADAGVIGVYSEAESTELPRAFIVPKDVALMHGPDVEKFKNNVHEWLAKRIAPYKLLRGGIELVEAIPRNPSGKILRKDLRGLSKGGAKL